MSNLPPGWMRAKLADVASTQLGRMLSSRRETGAYARPYLRNRDVQWGHINVSDLPSMDFSPEDADRFRLTSGDVLVCEGGEVGRAAIWKDQIAECYFQKAIHRVRTSQALSPEFLRYLLEHYARSKAFASFTSGSTIAHLPQEDLRNLPINLPPRAEQERIVAAVEEQFSRLDAGVAALEQAQHNLRRIRAAALEGAVPSGEGLAPAVPLGDLVAPGKKIAYGVLVPGDHDPDGIPFVRVGDLSGRQVSTQNMKHIAPAIAAHYPRTRLQGGEVLLSLVGTIGRTAVVPPELAGANVARALAVIPVQETVDPRYAAIALSRDRVTRELTNLSHEVARKTLNLEDVRKYEIPLPSYPEQLEIVKAVETEETWIRAVEEVAARTFRRSGNLRSSILQAAFAGRLVPQDENDEPLSALLAGIASERASLKGYALTRGRKPRMLREEATA